MTKLTSPAEKPPAEEAVHLEEEDESESDDDLKKNIYNEIPEYDDVDEVKLAVVGLDMDAALRQQNLANENLYSEIRPSDERFENALYMANEKRAEEKQKSVAGDVFPSMSPKTRSFFRAAPLPSIPPSSKKIPEEPEPSWCCGTRRRRRRSLVLGLFISTLFLLFLCVALLVRMYVPQAVDGDDDRVQGGWNAEAVKAGAFDDSAWLYADRVVPLIVVDENVAESELTTAAPERAHAATSALTPREVQPNRTTTRTSPTPMATSSSSSSSSSSPAGFDDGISTAEFLNHDPSLEDGWAAENQVVPTKKAPVKTFHTKSICTSWQGRRRLSLNCPTSDGRIEVNRAFYGWSESEAVCRQVVGDTYCKTNERDVAIDCDDGNSCEFWADASGWLIGCHGWHDFLQVDFSCVRS